MKAGEQHASPVWPTSMAGHLPCRCFLHLNGSCPPHPQPHSGAPQPSPPLPRGHEVSVYSRKMTQSHGLYRRTPPPPIGTAHLPLPWSSRLKSLLPRPPESQRQSQLDWPALGLKQEVVSDVKNLWSFLDELEALLVLGMCLLWSQVVPCTEAALLGALDPPEPARAFLLDATASGSAPGCEHVGVCDTELRQPFLHKERPRAPDPSLDGPGQECLVGNRPSPAGPPPHPLPLSQEGQCLSSSLLVFFSLTVFSPFGGGGEPDAEALSPGGGTPVFPRRPPKSLTSKRLTAKQPAIWPHFPALGFPTEHHSTPISCLLSARGGRAPIFSLPSSISQT